MKPFNEASQAAFGETTAAGAFIYPSCRQECGQTELYTRAAVVMRVRCSRSLSRRSISVPASAWICIFIYISCKTRVVRAWCARWLAGWLVGSLACLPGRRRLYFMLPSNNLGVHVQCVRECAYFHRLRGKKLRAHVFLVEKLHAYLCAEFIRCRSWNRRQHALAVHNDSAAFFVSRKRIHFVL